MLKLTDIQKLTDLIYFKKRYDLERWLTDQKIDSWSIKKIDGNDRCIFFKDPDVDTNIVYVAVAGSDDVQDWKENFKVKVLKNFLYMKEGVAVPASEILDELLKWCKAMEIKKSGTFFVFAGHSRGADIVEGLTALHNDIYGETFSKSWCFGLTGAGSLRFYFKCRCKNLTSFMIKGDFAKWINPINKCIGKTITLPKQIKGFWKRFFGLFRKKINHRKYDCINNMHPYNKMNAKGEY